MSEEKANVIQVPFGEHMRRQFMVYSLDVITSRALPDVYTGLKPVQTRILESMNDLGIHHDTAYKKCARTVGDALGRYHPHGDQSVYDAMVNMAQDFTMRYPLVDGHGNFGSIDGDPPAAMRYTEARLSKIGDLMLKDIKKDTVKMVPNFDESTLEAQRLPGLFPGILANGCSGIAVGMASSFLPHCAKDVYKAADKILENALQGEDTDDDELIRIVKAPDFPTGGVIVGYDGIRNGYLTGHGSIKVRCQYHIERRNSHDVICITEVPYKVNKSKMVEEIAEAKKRFNLDIRSVYDYSAKGKINVEIELNRGAHTTLILNNLLKHTDMQVTCSFNHTAIVDGKPVANINLKQLLTYFLSHCVDVIRNRIAFDLKNDQKRLPILSAMQTVLSDEEHTTKAISIIRRRRSKREAVEALSEAFELTKEQAEYIGSQQIWNLNPEMIAKIIKEYKDIKAEIEKYEAILSSDTALIMEVRTELQEISDKYFANDKRKTEIVMAEDDASALDLVEKKDIFVTFTNNGLVKAVDLADYNTQGKAGKGSSMKLKDEDFVLEAVTVNTHDNLLIVTNIGKGYILPAYKIPIVKPSQAGKYVNNYVQMTSDEHIVSILPVSGDKDKKSQMFMDQHSLLFVTKGGISKRISLSNISIRSNGLKLLSFKEGDSLVSCSMVEETDNVLIATADGFALNLPVSAIRIMGRTAVGNIAIRFKSDTDYVVSAVPLKEGNNLFILTQKGMGKQLDPELIAERKNAGGKGMYCYKPTDKSGRLVGVIAVNDDKTIIVMTQDGLVIRVPAESIRATGRMALGSRIIKLNDGDSVLSAIAAPKSENEEEDIADE